MPGKKMKKTTKRKATNPAVLAKKGMYKKGKYKK